MAESFESLPSVRDVLGLAELAAGAPELVTGETGLSRSVRWAHVVAGREAVALLDGGELVLTTGAGWPQESEDPEGLAALVETLVAASPAAIVFELGTRFDETPRALVTACAREGIPLIVLHREVRFVQITQRVHQRLLTAQNEALEARAEVHAMLTELGLNRSPVDYVVDRIAETLGAPVVLESAGHQVVAWSGTDTTVLDHWSGSERRHHGFTPELPEGAIRVPVEAQGTRWGTLTALPGPPHPAGRETVLELGAFALALARLADPDGEQWIDFGSKRLFDAVLEGRYSGERELSTQLAAGGLTVEDRVLLGATLSGTGDFGTHGSLETAILSTALRRTVAPEGQVILAPSPGDTRTLLVLLSFPENDPRLTFTHSPDTHPLALRLEQELGRMLPATTPASWRAHLSLGVTARRPLALIASLERIAAGAGALAPSGGGPSRSRVTVQLAEERPLAYLVRGLAGMPEVEEFAAALLDPLVSHDSTTGAGHTGDLLQVLAAYLAHPTNRSLAAKQARLSRSVFYQRIALIEELLGVDLTDGETIAALSVALLARGGM
ncbi:PucR family transcriptional regulator [Leucobacter denitrificans]|uniref:PucR family transcriptional regulator n=1 Tax=Leucobacter denitrificans TaxID=683042 RepID=UPI001FE37CA1|nr:PucR family transcriptional regulator [Leucobacter denitrificans]